MLWTAAIEAVTDSVLPLSFDTECLSDTPRRVAHTRSARNESGDTAYGLYHTQSKSTKIEIFKVSNLFLCSLCSFAVKCFEKKRPDFSGRFVHSFSQSA